jgi:hypothetical protein
MNDKIIQYCKEKNINVENNYDFTQTILNSSDFWDWIYEQEKVAQEKAIIGIITGIKGILVGILQKIRGNHENNK